jgi:2-polyprenyl-3-methyl-5-hydroxy-6-metoxy-1,4-benzoquinol methylase
VEDETNAVSCPVCRSGDTLSLFDTHDRLLPLPGIYRFVRCDDCGLTYVDPAPTWAQRAPHYALAYRGYHRLETEPSALQRSGMRAGLARRHRLVTAHVAGGRLLDVGCGGGDYLGWVAQQPGWQAVGLERTPGIARAAMSCFRVPVVLGDIEQAGFAAGSFDAVTLWAVLEHVPDPVRSLAECARMLRPGGVLVVRTLAAEAWAARFFGACWVGYDAPRVLSVFTRRALHRALNRAGLRLLEIGYPFHDFFPWVWSLRNSVEDRTGSERAGRLAERLAGSWPVRLLSFPLFALQTRRGGNSFVVAVAQSGEQDSNPSSAAPSASVAGQTGGLARRNAAPAVTLVPVSRETWDQFVAQCHDPPTLLFHTSAWLDLLARSYRLAWLPLGIWQGEELTGLFPVLTRRLGPFRLAGSPLMVAIASTPFLGPLVEPGQIGPALVALETQLSQWKVSHVELALPSELEAMGLARSLGYSLETCQGVRVLLAGRCRVDLWGALTPAFRRGVRKAQAHNVDVVEAHDGAFLDEYWQMCKEVYRGSGRPPHLSRDFYAAAWESLAPLGKIRALLALREGELLAGALFLLHGDQAYYLSGASHIWGLPWRPNNLIQWHFLDWAGSQGLSCYDLGGAVVPGITRFKLGLGGQLYSYTRLYKATSPLAGVGRELYRKGVPFWRRIRASGSPGSAS